MCIALRGGKDLLYEVQLYVLPRGAAMIFVMKSNYVYCI